MHDVAAQIAALDGMTTGELADDAEVRVMAPKTMICPPQVGESATVTRPVARADAVGISVVLLVPSQLAWMVTLPKFMFGDWVCPFVPEPARAVEGLTP